MEASKSKTIGRETLYQTA
ncbi:UNVERIFIED_CONTAM: hypothetical protein GTU68_050489 [Idotea baltica]|nr:hypothetical protein [Idotea baltica]